MTAFKPMLAKEGNPRDLTYPVYAQIKYDGIRASVVDGVLVSRTLKPIRNAEIQAALGRPEFNGLDGELIVGDPAAKGCMQKTSSFVMAPNKTGEAWAYYVFDKWDEPGPFTERMWHATDLIMKYDWTDLPIFDAHFVLVDSRDDLERYEEIAVAQGHEGIIVRTLDSPYKFGRSGKTGPLLKIKRFIDFEAEVIGVYEKNHNANEATRNALGRTERSTKKAGMVGVGVLGGLVLTALNGPHKGETFRCGTGFNDEQRRMYWEQVDTAAGLHSVIGRTAKIKSFPVGVKDAPRFPVFLGWRDAEDMS